MTKVDIISGFLGAGKTTFIKQMIDQVFQGQKLVLIENEFGEIGIDGGFLKDAGIEITEMNSGCICCTLVGDFSIALKKVLDEYAPDRVLIEPSGVGKLSDIVRAVEAVKKDAPIVISRTQMMKPEAVEECVSLLRGENDQAAIITTPWEQLDAGAIRRALEHKTGMEDLLEDVHDHEHCHHDHEHHDHEHHDHEHCCHDHHHHHADEIFTSWGKETAHQYTEEELEKILQTLSGETGCGTVLRAKGILCMADGTWKQFDLVPGEYEVREGRADYTGRLCVIGTDLAQDQLAELFHLV